MRGDKSGNLKLRTSRPSCETRLKGAQRGAFILEMGKKKLGHVWGQRQKLEHLEKTQAKK